MKQFLAGIVVASLLWGGLIFAEKTGLTHLLFDATTSLDTVAPPPNEATLASEEVEDARPKVRRGRRKRRAAPGSPMPAGRYDTTEGVSGDMPDTPSAREVSMGAGGEDQLSPQEIDQGIDRVFKGIERCLLTLPPDAPAAGKIVFGMVIASSGRVTKVNLKGPNVMIQGETGACFRKTVQSIRFRSFDGPDMVANYPVVFD